MGATLSGPAGHVELGTTTLKIGRLPENQLIIDDAQASSLHAEIHSDAGGYTLIDLGSTGGTFVNKQRLAPHTPRHLQAGDIIGIGDTQYTYVFEGSCVVESLDVSASEPTAHLERSEQREVSMYQSSSPVYSPPAQSSLPFSSLEHPAHADTVLSIQHSEPLIPETARSHRRAGLSKKLWVIGGVLAIVLALVGIVLGVLFFLNLPTPARTLDAFCTDIQSKKGQDAFNLLSDGLQRRSLSGRELFISVINSGQIVNCTHSSPVASDNNASARLTLTVSGGQSQTDTVLLIVDHGGGWKISRLQMIQS
jgi:hypothetical protein